jgi:hypothetical protein
LGKSEGGEKTLKAHEVGDLPSELNRTDVLLLLLYAPGMSQQPNEPIAGRTRLQKELFLVQQQLRVHGVKSMYSFRPYRRGPLSYELYNDLDWLKYENRILEENTTLKDGTSFSIFSLKPEGVKEVQELLKRPPWNDVLEIAQKVKALTNNISLTYLVESVHHAYPEYMLKSEMSTLLREAAAALNFDISKNRPRRTKKRAVKTPMLNEIRALRSGSDEE